MKKPTEGNEENEGEQPAHSPGEITRLLKEIRAGRLGAREDLIPLVYEQLRRIAQQRMAREREDHTLQPTELVHEAYLRLVPALPGRDWQDRSHFFAAAAEAMRRVLIDYARQRATDKRGGGRSPVPINLIDVAAHQAPEEILAINDAFERLEKQDAQLGQVVRLRFFAGLSVEETAEVLNISRRSVIRHWTFARAWLFRALQPKPSN